MNYKKKIMDYMNESSGMITSSYCKENGIPTIYLNRLEKSGLLFKIEKGLYLNNDANYDDDYFFQYRFKKTIYSYETALFLQGLTDRLPLVKDVSVPYNYKFNDLRPNINVYYVNKNIFELGSIKIKTMYGNFIRVYSFERILCDFIAHKDKIDIEIYLKAIKSYQRYDNRDLNKLFEIAQKMKIEKAVREVMEIAYE
jgi:predicted transcriptional regulator of viral defense system